MATNNIRLPDGSTIAIPAWASESTLQQLLIEARKNSTNHEMVENAIRSLDLDSEEFQDALANLDGAIRDAAKKEKEKSKAITDKLRSSGSKIAGALNDTSRPLTGMTNAMGALAEGAGGVTSEFLKGSKWASKFGDKASMLGDVGVAAAGTFMTWVGWNAAKMEQFAEAQQSMIDSGVIFFDTSGAFNDLYTQVQQNGITYAQLTNVVTQYGFGIAGLSKGVSDGTKVFADLISGDEGILKLSDKFGDYGLSHDELMNVYAQYIETQVRQGRINGDIESNKNALNESFNKLMLETTAYASLTGMNRSAVLKSMLDGMNDVMRGSALTDLEKSGHGDVATRVNETLNALGLFAEMSGESGAKPLFDQLQKAMIEGIAVHADNPSLFNIEHQLSNNPALQQLVRQSGLSDLLNRVGKGEEVAFEEMTEFFNAGRFAEQADQFAKLSGNTSELAELAWTLSVAENEIRNRTKDVGEKINEAGGFYEYVKRTGELSEIAGQSVVSMNNMTTTFIQAQEAITLDLQSSSETVKEFTDIMQKATDWVKKAVNGTGDDVTAPPTNELDINSLDPSMDSWWNDVFLPASEGLNPMRPRVDTNASYITEPYYRNFNTQEIEDDAFAEELNAQIEKLKSEGKTTQEARAAVVQQYGIEKLKEAGMIGLRDFSKYAKIVDGKEVEVSKQEYDLAVKPEVLLPTVQHELKPGEKIEVTDERNNTLTEPVQVEYNDVTNSDTDVQQPTIVDIRGFDDNNIEPPRVVVTNELENPEIVPKTTVEIRENTDSRIEPKESVPVVPESVDRNVQPTIVEIPDPVHTKYLETTVNLEMEQPDDVKVEHEILPAPSPATINVNHNVEHDVDSGPVNVEHEIAEPAIQTRPSVKTEEVSSINDRVANENLQVKTPRETEKPEPIQTTSRTKVELVTNEEKIADAFITAAGIVQSIRSDSDNPVSGQVLNQFKVRLDDMYDEYDVGDTNNDNNIDIRDIKEALLGKETMLKLLSEMESIVGEFKKLQAE